MATSRETIYLAMRAKMGDVVWDAHGFVTMSRRVKLFADVPAGQQPACYQAEHEEISAQTSNLPYKRKFMVKWIVYQRTGSNKSIAGAIENNKILDAVQDALTPKPGDDGYPNRQTLGGLVYHCFVDGSIFKDPGDLDDQGMMVIPITMLVP